MLQACTEQSNAQATEPTGRRVNREFEHDSRALCSSTAFNLWYPCL